MGIVEVKKEELLEALKANRDAHRGEFLEAQTGWRETIIKELDRRLADARAFRKIKAAFSFPEPEDHKGDYDRVIRMVEMSVAPTIPIDENDFAQYVMDDWGWKANWTGSNTAYIATARAAKSSAELHAYRD